MPGLGPIELLICLIPAAGLIIGITTIVAIAAGRRKNTGQTRDVSAESVGVDTLSESRPWLDNGFVSGLFTGLGVGVGLMAPFLAVWLWRLLSASRSSIPTEVACVELLAAIGLAFLLGAMAKKVIVGRGLDSAGYTGKGIGRLMLAIVGVILGIGFGIACLLALAVPVVMLWTLRGL